MKINVILADTGQSDPSGKLHLLGSGWTVTSVGPGGVTPSFAVAVFIEVPWDQCNREIAVALDLVNEDESPVEVHTESGPQPFRLEHTTVVPAIPGAPNGSPGQASILVAIQGGLPLAPGNWYKWKVSVDGVSDPLWRASFFVQRQPSAPSFGRAS